jgi:hypothetical protein
MSSIEKAEFADARRRLAQLETEPQIANARWRTHGQSNANDGSRGSECGRRGLPVRAACRMLGTTGR